MTDNLSPIGLYLHIPFCSKKCAYCDFYSSFYTKELIKDYTAALIRKIKKWGGQINRPIDSIYLGGGTPSLLKQDLVNVIDAVRSSFSVADNAEITLEINPDGDTENILGFAKKAGVNRISIGIQSGDDAELKVLGRTHSSSDAASAFKTARKLGFDNISVDIMLGLPNSDNMSLKQSIDYILSLNPEHISAYILKIEQNTAFYKQKDKLCLPDDDEQANQYILLCNELEKNGYCHYEISNFCKDGFESRHNIKYWRCEEYLGIGASAHSFLDSKRFYYPRDLSGFIKGNETVFDSDGGDQKEYIMLNLRLKSGINYAEYETKFKSNFSKQSIEKAKLLQKAGLIKFNQNGFALTNEGMLLSNSIINEIIGENL